MTSKAGFISPRVFSALEAALPEGLRILRFYRAFEGDVRVIAWDDHGRLERRFSVSFDVDGNPRLREM